MHIHGVNTSLTNSCAILCCGCDSVCRWGSKAGCECDYNICTVFSHVVHNWIKLNSDVHGYRSREEGGGGGGGETSKHSS